MAAIAMLNGLFYFGIEYALIRFRMIHWYLQTVDRYPESDIELVQYRFPSSIAYVRVHTPYVIRHSGQEWRATFSEAPLRSVGCVLSDASGNSRVFAFDTSLMAQPRPLPLVVLGDAKTILTPRQDFGLPNDLPSGWIAIRIYKPGVEFEAVEKNNERVQSTNP